MRIPVDGFLLSMIIAIIVALIVPQLGVSGGFLHLDWVTTVGVGLIFLFSGASLHFDKLKAGAANWRLHLFVQLFTFAVFPIIGIIVSVLFKSVLPQPLLIGFFYLCALPSTVSSSIALTTLARGNVVGAVFNATASSLLGMVLTPLFISLWLQTSGPDTSLLDQLIKIGEQLLLPFAVGQLLRPWIGAWVTRNKKTIGLFDRGVIVLIIFNSFCNATAAGIWSDYGLPPLVIAAVMAGLLLVVVLSLTRFTAKALGFSTEDEITAMFCGSKKSLAMGAPMAALIFGSNETLGLIMLPIMIYHPVQLIICSVIAKRYAARPHTEEEAVAARS